MNGTKRIDELSTMRQKRLRLKYPCNAPRSASPSSEKSRRRRPFRKLNLSVAVLVGATCVLLLWHLSTVSNGSGESHRISALQKMNPAAVFQAKEFKDVKMCVVFQVYNHVERYEAEVQASIARLKKLNPDVTTILITDNKDISSNSNDGDANKNTIDVLKVIQLDSSLLRLVGINDFTTRLKYLSTLHSWAPDCDMHVSLDSHVTVCSSNLKQRLFELYADPTFHIGTNVEHNPYPSWKSTPFTYDPVNGNKFMPHNFCIVMRTHSAPLIQLLQTWYEYMTSWKTKLATGFDADDQKPLQKLLLTSSSSSSSSNSHDSPIALTRLEESFAMAEKSVHKRKYGFYPRFTYALEQNVTLIHSHRKEGIPTEYHGDMCAFMNGNNSDAPRMLIRQEGNATHPGLYELIYSAQHCEDDLRNFEPRICRDPAQLYGLKSTALWLQSTSA